MNGKIIYFLLTVLIGLASFISVQVWANSNELSRRSGVIETVQTLDAELRLLAIEMGALRVEMANVRRELDRRQ